MTHDQISKITRDAIQRVQYERCGLSEGVLSIRYIDKTDTGWKIAFWLKGTIGTDIHVAAPTQASDESVTTQIIEQIESNLAHWRELIASAGH